MKLILTDKKKEQKAEVLVHSFTDDLITGEIVSHMFDESLKQKMTEFEELVNSFCIGELLDEATLQLDAYTWQVEGRDWVIHDFQVFDLKDVSFRIKKIYEFDVIDFIAELQFSTTEQGGRKKPVASGYRPHIEFDDYPEYLTSGQQTYLGQETVVPGVTVLAEISILSKEYFVNKLHENMTFKFCEGAHIMGYGKILEVVNANLKRKEL